MSAFHTNNHTVFPNSPQPVIPPHRHISPQLRERRLQRLETSVKRTAVDGADGRIEGDDSLGQLLGLLNAVRGERRVGGDVGGRRHVGVIFARGGVEGPVDAELEPRRFLVSPVFVAKECGVGLWSWAGGGMCRRDRNSGVGGV